MKDLGSQALETLSTYNYWEMSGSDIGVETQQEAADIQVFPPTSEHNATAASGFRV